MYATAGINLVSTIFQFIDEGLNTCKACKEIHGKGLRADYLALERHSNVLGRMAGVLEESVSIGADDSLKDVCVRCVQTADELGALLDEIKTTGKGPTNAVKAYVKTLRRSGKIKRLERDLEESRQRMRTALLVSL